MNKYFNILLAAACTVTLTACGQDKIIFTGNQKIDGAVYNDDTISLAPYTGLKAEKKNYKITEDALDQAIHEQLIDYIDYQAVDRASRDGDIVNIDYTITIDGESYDEDNDYDYTLGEKEYGGEFDQKLTGISAGGKLEFSIDYSTDFPDMDFAGHTVNFNITVNKIQEEILPDMTDDFIQNNFGYDNYDAFVEATRDSLENDYEEESANELSEELLQQVIDNSSILQYTQKEYEEAYDETESTYAEYADMLGTDIDSIYDSLDIDEDSLKQEALENLSRTFVTNAIIKNEKMSLSDDEYEKGVSEYMEINDYDSKEEFIRQFGEDVIRKQLLEDKAVQFIVDHSEVTEVDAEYEDF